MLNDYYSARALYAESTYEKWSNFNNLVLRAENLIKNGFEKGIIRHSTIEVIGGYGAKQIIKDYDVDEQAKLLIEKLSSRYKIDNSFPQRNELCILHMINKYFSRKGCKVNFQSKRGDFVFDMIIDDRIGIEFDEPHHLEFRHKLKDKIKYDFCLENDIILLRFDLSHDIVDMILKIEQVQHTIPKTET